MSKVTSKPVAYEALCQSCPSEQTVREVLSSLGFSLVFQMPVQTFPSLDVPALPAQYHYHDQYGTEVIFLAGQDTNLEEDYPLLPHRSRWWVYTGAHPGVAQAVMACLSAHWFLAWFLSKEPQGRAREETA